MNTLSRILSIKRKDLVIVRILVCLVFYYGIYTVSSFLVVPFFIIFGITVFAYQCEISIVIGFYNSFEDDNLFFRFGSRVDQSIFPIRYSENLSNDETKDILTSIEDFLVSAIEDQIDSRIESGVHKTEIVTIVDRNLNSEKKWFLRFSFTGERGGEVNHFLLFEFIGAYTIIHIDTYVKGIPHWYDKVDFLLRSPFRIWFWGIPYIREDFSILTTISEHLDNSFEVYDIKTYLVASRHSILDSIRSYLTQNDLLTDELESIINFQMVYNNNVSGNQISVNGSDNKLSSIIQKS